MQYQHRNGDTGIEAMYQPVAAEQWLAAGSSPGINDQRIGVMCKLLKAWRNINEIVININQ